MARERFVILFENRIGEAPVQIAIVSDASVRFETISSETSAISNQEPPPADESASSAAAVANALKGLGYDGEPVVIGLSSNDCLPVTAKSSELSAAGDRQAFLYQLEEFLPLAAEEMVADYQLSQDRVFAVAGQLASLLEFVSELEEYQIPVQSIAPIAIMATQQLGKESKGVNRLTIWFHDDKLELFFAANSKPVRWVTTSPAELALELRAAEHQGYEFSEILVCGCPADVELSIQRQVEGEAECREDDYYETAARFGSRVIKGVAEPLIELRRDGLAPADRYGPIRGWIRATMAMAAIMCGAAIAGMAYQGWRFQELASRVTAEQETVFKRLFPDAKVPRGVRSRLQSEYNKVAGQSGQSADLPPVVSATDVMGLVLESLPNNQRLMIHQLRVEERNVSMNGLVRNFAAAEAIATALRESGFDVEPPKSDRVDSKTVTFRITAK
jgi:hypothetical protein